MNRTFIKWALVIALGGSVVACTGLPKLSLTPVSVESEIGGEHSTASERDAVVALDSGDTANYVADTVEQTYETIHQYPLWLILSFALAVGMAIPSPIAAWSHWQRRRDLRKVNTALLEALKGHKEDVT